MVPPVMPGETVLCRVYESPSIVFYRESDYRDYTASKFNLFSIYFYLNC